MKETVITWTVNNWITVFLMVMLMLAAVGFGMKVIHSAKGKTVDSGG